MSEAARPDVHEEVTVARAKPDLSGIKTIMDAIPFGSGSGGLADAAAAAIAASSARSQGHPASGIPTPLVPPPDPQSPPFVVHVPPTAKTMMLGQTMNDPDVEARARALRDQVLGIASTAAAPPVAAQAPSAADPSAPPAPAKQKANLNRTMMMGGEKPPLLPMPMPMPAPAQAAPAPAASPAPALAAAGGQSAPPATAGSAPPPASRGDASPLSRSVLAPHSWNPPPLAPAAPAAPAAPDAAPPADVATAPVPVPPQAPAPAPAHPVLRTMLGMPATALPVAPPRGNLGSTMLHPGAPSHPVAPVQAPGLHNAQKTMLGVAIPGIAPTHGPPSQHHAGHPGQHGPGDAPPPSMPVGLRSQQSTMLGVAIPGIAPTHSGPPAHAPGTQQIHQHPAQQPHQLPHQHQQPRMPSQVQNTALGVMAPPELKIVPRPKTLIDEPLPVAPQIPQKRGMSALTVVGIVFAVVLVLGGGGVVYVALRGGGALTAIPQLDENGRESLKIGCPTCPDGTTVSLGASNATVTAGATVLPLPAPLSIGDNDLTVKIERPSGGRNEDVKVHVPVAYRVRADLSTLSLKPPVITVRVEATTGSTVTVDEQPITLDPTGRGSYAIDLSKETEGEGEGKTFERKIPFAITPKGGKLESGQLTARTSIVPLALDAPGRELITDKASAAVSGQTRIGTILTIDGQSVPVDAQGRFGVRVELPAMGEKPLEIMASAPPLAPRIVKVKVTRVASLDAASKGEDAQNPLTYDAFSAETATKVGQKAVVEGEIIEARTTLGHTVLLIEDKKRCAKGASCLVRVGHGDDTKVARGDTVRVYGRILGSVTASGKTVPDLEGTLVLPLKSATK